MPRPAASLWWLALGLTASAAWFVTASRLAHAWGLGDAAPALGLAVAAVVALTLWRWSRVDREQMSLARLRCPRCSGALDMRHEHARPAEDAGGVQCWTCGRCGYERVERLTCAECAA